MSKKSSKPSVKDLVLATKTLSPLDNPQISSTRSGKNKKTEETFSITTYTTGQTVKLTQSKEGVQELTVTKPPECKTINIYD